MTIEPDDHSAVMALNRFGMGAKPGDLSLAGSDPRGFLLEELRTPNVALIDDPNAPTTSAALQLLYRNESQKRIEQQRAALAAPPKPQPIQPMSGNEGKKNPNAEVVEIPLENKLFQAEALRRFRKQAEAGAGFVERLVSFWSNHFAVSVAKGSYVLVAAGAFEREAIRPHVLGKFSELLQAVESHPAMICYLDNQLSIGPTSYAGRLDAKGMNENFAREILELHTLGVDGGYTQNDVTALARILTGWSLAEASAEAGEPGAFVFKSNWHEPGVPRLLGMTYPQEGKEQGNAALSALAQHPSSARHVATKLARHFVADQEPPDLVAALMKTFLETDGDLFKVSAALVMHQSAWRQPVSKIRTPNEFILAWVRATGFLLDDPAPILNLLNILGMPLWQPSGPNGFADTVDAWVSPAAMKLRLDVSWLLGLVVRKEITPTNLLDVVSGHSASRETREAVAHAESRQQAHALLLMSPEFQRR